MNRIVMTFALTLAFGLCLNALPLTMAEGDSEPAAVEQVQEAPAEVKREEPKPEPKREEAKPEAPEAKAEEPEQKKPESVPAEDAAKEQTSVGNAEAEPAVPDEARAPAASEGSNEAPVSAEEAASEASETSDGSEGKVIEIEEPEAPKGVFQEAGRKPFRGSVWIERKGNGAIYFGDRVVLEAKVRDANADYRIRWEVDRQDGAGWETVPGASEEEYGFVVTEENAAYAYRVVLVRLD